VSVVVGTLTIDLKANTASFSQSMDKMSQLSAKTANDVKRSLEKIAAVGIAMGAAIATGTVALIKGSLDAADAMGKMAQKTGTTVETLSVLSYAAKLADVETETLAKGLEKLSQASFKAQNGNVQLQRIFDRLGVSTKDANGNLQDSGIVMEEIAVKFAGMQDGAGKTALAMAIFGKGGAALIPMLNELGEKQQEINAEAHRYGLVLSTSTVDVAAKAHDDLKRLDMVFTGMGYSLLSATLPALDELLQKLISISQTADLQGLAKAFGGEVVKAVHLLGDALDFAVTHAHELKLALEALAGLKLAAIAIPIIGDLQKGGIENIGKGLDKLTIGFLGLGRVIPVLAQFGGWLRTEITFMGMLASEEGIASAATYVLGGAITAMGGPVGIAIAAIAGLTAAIYHFRDATFTVKGQTYELRDIWAGAWIQMKDAMRPVGDFFSKLMGDIKNLWSEMVNWIKQNSLAKSIIDDVSKATSWMKGHLVSLAVSDSDIDALNRAKAQREGIDPRFLRTIPPPAAPHPVKPAPYTSGLGGKPQKDIYGDEINKLDLAIEQQKAYLAVLDGTPEQINAAAAAEKARGIIVELNNRLTDEGRAKLTAKQAATIGEKVATELSLKGLEDYGKELVAQQHSADLSIQQTRAMAAANLEGDAAIRQATIDNAILGLTYNRTAEQLKQMAPELAKLRDELTAKASIDIVAGTNRDIDGLRDELAQRKLVLDATLDSIDAQREAALASKLYTLNQSIADTTDAEARAALLAKRDALVAVAKAENDAADAQAALSLQSPAEQYDREMDSLNHAVEALKTMQDGTLSYGQQLQVAARQQDEFNRATDETANLLLREGTMGDGVTAFFLKMQEQAKTAAATIFEVMNETFNKLSENLTALITAPNRWKRSEVMNQFGSMFADIGKNLLDTTIKQSMQGGLGALGKVFGVNLAGTGKVDGSTAGSALWVRWAAISGAPNELANLGASTGSGSPAGSIFDSLKAKFFGRASAAPEAATGAVGALQRPAAANELQRPAANELTDLLGSVSTAAPGAGSAAAPASIPSSIPGSISVAAPSVSVSAGAQAAGAVPALPEWPSLGNTSNAPESPTVSSRTPGAAAGAVAAPPLARVATLLGGATRGQPGPTGIVGGVLSAIGSLFSKKPAAAGAPASSPAPAVSAAFGTPRANELENLSASASPAYVQTIPTLLQRAAEQTPSSPGASGAYGAAPANELTDLAASSPAAAVQAVPTLLRQGAEQTASSPSTPVSPSSPGAPVSSALQSLPERLSQGSDLSWLMPPSTDAAAQGDLPWLVPPSTDAAPGDATGNATVLPQPPAFWPESHEASSPVGAPSQTGAVIPNPPDTQAKPITEITKPKPTLFDEILSAGINFAGQVGGQWAAGKLPTGGSGSGGASGSSDNSWAQAASPDDNLNDAGIVTDPSGNGWVDYWQLHPPDETTYSARGGKISGPGTGTSDSIPAMLSHGEYVINANATAKHLPLLHKINKGFAAGGLVGYDDGGYVAPSMAYVSAERGAGQMAAASTRIAGSTSSSSVSTRNYGDTHNHYIDARGSTDPAQTTANIDRYMKKAGPQIAAAAVHAVKDQQMRRAPSAK
jgi:hypothetical protein